MSHLWEMYHFPLKGEAWSDQVLADYETMSEADKNIWVEIFTHCLKITGGKPSGKWLKTASGFLNELGHKKFVKWVLTWFPLVNKPRTKPEEFPGIPEDAPADLVEMMRRAEMNPAFIDMRLRQQEARALALNPVNIEFLKGLACFASLIDNRDVARALTALTLSSFRKIPQIGSRAVKVGNACIYALSALPGMTGVDQLAILKVKVRSKSAMKSVEKALNATAERLGISKEELEEIGIPSYGMAEVGVLRQPMGDFTANARVTSSHTMELLWEKADGKTQKSVPATVKETHAEDLKALKAAMKDIQKMVPAQRDRIDRLFISRRVWPFATWRERYLNHPLLGYLTRRVIWTFTTGSEIVNGIYLDGQLVDVHDQPVEGLTDQTSVALWHPINHSMDDVLAWRTWLEKHEVQQPFKQAHREVYVLTDAERETRIYSNRFAAHIIKQNQFHSLAGIRRWNNALKMIYEGAYRTPASLSLPEWNLRAEFWTEGVEDHIGTDHNETGTLLYLATDQVRFWPLNAQVDPVPLEDVPPRVLSEVMRDVDLFIGVASVGNDPNWADGGPEGHYRNYWTSYSFGELSLTAATRKEVLERIIPRLKIKDRCSFTDRFLVVEGDLRTYKIHIGSANILMTPNDQYLCIVPQQGGHMAEREPTPPGGKLFLPFEGDHVLSIIISKALLLAEDRKINDPTIMHQIQRK